MLSSPAITSLREVRRLNPSFRHTDLKFRQTADKTGTGIPLKSTIRKRYDI